MDIRDSTEMVKTRLMELSVAMPIFEIEGDSFNALYVSGICMEPDRLRISVMLYGVLAPCMYSYATPIDMEHRYRVVVEAWKSGLNRLYK